MNSPVRTVRQQVTDRLRQEVIAGRFAAGQMLREAALAEEFGVSRGPIRDAFLQLTQEGLLVYQAHRGVTVRPPPDPKNRRLIVSLRRRIECTWVRQGMHSITETGWQQIDQALKQLRLACLGGEVGEIAQCDLAFHEAILVACGGESFVPMWRWLCSQMLMAYSRLENYEQVYLEHERIAEALRSGDRSEATRALKANIR